MNFINLKTHLIILFLSSFILNIYYICYVSIGCKEITNPEYLLNNTNNNLSNNFNEYLLNYDQRFSVQQENFQPKDFFPINEYLNDNELKNYNKFYTRHVALNYPFVLKGETKKWKAFKNWQNNTYLLSKIGNLTIEVEKKPKNNKEFAYFKKDYKLEKMKYKIFLEKYIEFEKEEYIYYWAERKLPKRLLKDIKEPNFGKILNLEDINIWQGAAGTISLAHTDDRDNFLCQIVGSKELILIPPTQRNLLYIGLNDEPDNYSPINFFNPNYEKYPNFKFVRGKMYVKLEEGDLLYIPAFWWHMVKSSINKNIAVNFWYTAQYMMNLLFSGIQNKFEYSE